MGLCLEATFKPLWVTNGTTDTQTATQVAAQVIVTLRSYAIAPPRLTIRTALLNCSQLAVFPENREV